MSKIYRCFWDVKAEDKDEAIEKLDEMVSVEIGSDSTVQNRFRFQEDPLNEEEEGMILELARMALADAVTFDEMADNMDISDNELIANRCMTQATLAEKVKTSQPVISAIIGGKRRCGKKLANKISNALELTEDERMDFVPVSLLPIPLEKAIYYHTMRQCRSNHIDIDNIVSAVPTDNSSVIVMKDGTIYNVHITVTKSS